MQEFLHSAALGRGGVAWRWRSGRRCLLAACALLALVGIARAGTLVTFNTNQGSVNVDLFDDLTPQTVANFLNYVNSNRYQNTAIHRSVSNFVVQGGGYVADNTIFGGSPTHIPTFTSPQNEFHRTNSRGTIAMAKTPNNVNGASSEWFFNLKNNAGTPPLGLDFQNGGFTAFGWVVGTGMVDTVDKIAALPAFNTQALEGLPLQNYTLQDAQNNVIAQVSNLIVLNNISVVKTHPSFQNPVTVLDVNNDGAVFVQDALVVINELIANGQHAVNSPFSGTDYLDVSGNGIVDPLDALQIINSFLPQGASNQAALAAPQASFQLTALSLVPEPGTWALAACGLAGLGGYAIWRRSRALTKRLSPMRVRGRILLALLAAVLWQSPRVSLAGTLVDFSINQHIVHVDLYNDLTPLNVANFLQYVTPTDRYADSMVHSIGLSGTTPTTIQGGFLKRTLDPIQTFAPVANEAHASNLRGTLSATLSAGAANPANSATSQWFFNLTNNTSFDTANGGYTVFGHVVGDGMTFLDTVATLPRVPQFNTGDVILQNMPLSNGASFVVINSVTVIKTHPSYQNPVITLDVNNDGAVFVQDALIVINELIAHGQHALTTPYGGTEYLDVSGNGIVDPLDALQIINTFLPQGASNSAAPLASFQLSAASVVPEPSSLVLAAIASLAIAGYLTRRRLRRTG